MKVLAVACALTVLTLSGCNKQTSSEAAAATASHAQPDPAGWQFKTLKDAMTDKVRGIASLESSDGKQSRLVFKCDQPGADSIYVQFIFGEYLGATRERDEFRNVQYRVDGATPDRLGSDYDDRSLIVTDPKDVKRFAADVASGKRLVVRAKTYKYTEVDAEFDIAGSAEQIRRVAEVCKANPPA